MSPDILNYSSGAVIDQSKLGGEGNIFTLVLQDLSFCRAATKTVLRYCVADHFMAVVRRARYTMLCGNYILLKHQSHSLVSLQGQIAKAAQRWL